MKKIELYSFDQVEKLALFYSDQIVGKTFVGDLKFKISELEIVKFKNKKYQLICKGKILERPFDIQMDIKTFAENYNLKIPKEVLISE